MAALHPVHAAWMLLAIGLGVGTAAEIEVPTEQPIQAAPITKDPIQAPPLYEPGMRLLPPLEVPPVQAETPDAIRVHPLSDPWVTAEIERLKARAMRSGLTARGASTAQRRRNAAQAAWNLGLIHFHGAGVQQNPAQAQQWFRRAHDLGHPLASGGLALCEMDGCTGPANTQAARSWIALLRRYNTPRALFLEWLVEYRLSPITLSTSPEPGTSTTVALPAHDLLNRAAHAGDLHARIELALGLAAARNWTAALTQLELAAPRSTVAAANAEVIRGMLARQQVPEAGTSPVARSLLQEARRQHRGDGVTANYSEALRLYRQAEAEGSDEAGKMLALITSRPAPDGGVDIAWMRQLAFMDFSQALPTLGNPSSGYRLQREPSPLFDWLPQAWQDKVTGKTLKR